MKTVYYHGEEFFDYYVLENGEVINHRTGRTLKASSDSTCHYPRVYLNGRRVLVHRIVAEAFVPLGKPSASISDEEWGITPASVKQLIMKTMLVNHIDHDKENYHPSNLEWVTAEENARKRDEFYFFVRRLPIGRLKSA
jgi:HNH endonuclease